METAVQQPASYSGRDNCLDQAGPSGVKKVTPKKTFDGSRNKRRGSFGNSHDKVKRRRRNDIVLPTKFLLGGNITDPLNLKSLENEEVNRLANQTPVASPAAAAGGGSERVEVIIPKNINDPLNLNGLEQEPASQPRPKPPVKKNRRRKNQRRRPFVEQAQKPEVSSQKEPISAKKANNQRFRFGNYNRYYGYRNGSGADNHHCKPQQVLMFHD